MQINLDVLDEEINAIEQEMEIIIQSLGCMRENYDLPEVLKELQTVGVSCILETLPKQKSA